METLTVNDLHRWMADFATEIETHAEELTALDSAIGDADHGTNMVRGVRAVVDLDADAYPTPAEYLKKVGMTLVSTVGGASGPLYGTFFLRFALSVDGLAELDVDAVAKGLEIGITGIAQRGKAEPGEKTMLDALTPALAAFVAAEGLAPAFQAAAQAAAAGRDATVDMLATKGRASYLAERSIGHQDPGATSAALLMSTAAKAFAA